MNNEFNFEFPTIYREFLSQIDKEGEFLIENTGVVLYSKIDLEERNLNTLKMSGVFEGVKGLIFGKPEVYNNKNSNLEYIDIIKEVLGKKDYPIIYNFDCGHTIPSLMISQDSLLSLKASDKEGVKVEILKNSFIDD